MAGASSLPLDGRVAIVTGASRGIGRAIAVHLHSLGANLLINYASNSNPADILASELNSKASSSSGAVAVKADVSKPEEVEALFDYELNSKASSSSSGAVAVKADVSKPEEVEALFDQAEKEFGCEVHILVNCAGVLDPKYPTLANTTVEDFDSVINVNTRGAFLCCREAANRLTRKGGGRIITISTSVVGASLPGYSAYAASKAAVETMTKIMAKELKGSGITANCVAPGPVATELFLAGKTEETIKRFVDSCPLGRLGEPKDIAQLVGFLVTDAGEWVNGQVIRANGGFVV